MRDAIGLRRCDPAAFRAALHAVPPRDRDVWCDAVLDLGPLPDDGPALPRGCVPYLPCSVDAIQRLVRHAAIGPRDVFVDVGAGIGRAAALVHLLTGARTIGVEIQPALVATARELGARLGLAGFSFVEGDAADATDAVGSGTVFLLYCPFSGERLTRCLGGLQRIAADHQIRVGCVDMPLPPCPWLVALTSDGDLVVHRSAAPR